MLLQANTLLTGLAALAAVLGMILLVARWVRRAGIVPGVGRSRRLVLEEVLLLDGRRRLHLIRCDDRRMLVITGGGSDLLVGWLDPAGAPGPVEAVVA